MTPSKHRHPEISLEVKRTEWGGREEGSGLGREVGEKMNFEFCESLLSERLVFKANFHLFGGDNSQKGASQLLALFSSSLRL